MCSIYAAAVRRMLPRATLTADLFHVVHLAVKAVGDVRRRVIRARYGRRGRSGDPEYGIKGLLVRNLEHLSPAQFAKIIDVLDRDRYGQEIAAAWIAREELRHVLNLRARVRGSVPCERQVRDRLLQAGGKAGLRVPQPAEPAPPRPPAPADTGASHPPQPEIGHER